MQYVFYDETVLIKFQDILSFSLEYNLTFFRFQSVITD